MRTVFSTGILSDSASAFEVKAFPEQMAVARINKEINRLRRFISRWYWKAAGEQMQAGLVGQWWHGMPAHWWDSYLLKISSEFRTSSITVCSNGMYKKLD